MDTIKVKPWGADQGDHVVINAADFDPAVHQLLDAPAADTPPAAEQASAEAAAPAAKTTRRARAVPAADTTEG